MIQRRVVVPADPDRVWRALTDPEEAGAWLGGSLDWTPEEGEPLRFTPGPSSGDELTRVGRVEEAVPGRYLRFVWWPADVGPESGSEVTYVLEPAGEGPADEETVLTVEEIPAVPAACSLVRDDVAAAPAVMARATAIGTMAGAGWSRLDTLQLQVWAARRGAGVYAA